MDSFIFYQFNYTSKSIKLSYSKGENIKDAFEKTTFKIYSINELYIAIMELYEISNILNNWIKNSSIAITHSQNVIETYAKELTAIPRSDKNIILDFVIDKLYYNFIDYRNNVNSNYKLIFRIFDSWMYFPKKKNELQRLQKNIIACIGDDILIKENEEIVIFNNQNLIIDNICQYIDSNGNAYNVIVNNLLPFISDIIQFISTNDMKMKKCTNCHRYFVVDKSDKKITCSIKCRKEHLEITKKSRSERDSLKAETEKLYTDFAKKCRQRKYRLSDAHAPNDIITEMKNLTNLQCEYLLELKLKVNAKEISLDDFKSAIEEYNSISIKTYKKYMEDIKNGEHQKTQ